VEKSHPEPFLWLFQIRVVVVRVLKVFSLVIKQVFGMVTAASNCQGYTDKVP